ncbi:ABC transporter [Kiloniella litopenaei]|uniref:ABC transporter n=1 Tax=Kiloniella litopenaei TaxID=1549748 RepID=A0A0M2R6R9_9PROT|nr:ABC transporter permease [Kiloniella litopenaei]KKJ76124.1 ABC transporter [Kiloniella litopenaei]
MIDLDGYGYSILIDGGIITISISMASLFVACILGMIAALARLSNNRIASSIAFSYTTIIRGVPDLVLMLLIFFGGQIFVNNLPENLLNLTAWLGELVSGNGDSWRATAEPYLDWGYIDINPFIAGVLTIGFIFGAYMGETFRGAIMAVDHGMLEAGTAYGMTKGQINRRILLPQMVRHALPGIGNNWLVLMKASAITSIIGLEDMVRKAGLAAGATRQPFKFYLTAAVAFLILTTLSIWILKLIEKRYSAGVRSAL